MVAGKRAELENQVVNVLVDGVRLDQVRSFTCLDSRIDGNGKSEMEVRVKIGRVTSALAIMEGEHLEGEEYKNEEQTCFDEGNCGCDTTECP